MSVLDPTEVRADEGSRRELLTPEGVPLVFRLAGAGERAAAFTIDLSILIGVMVVLGLMLGMLQTGGSGWMRAFLILAFFLARNFYFVFFELRWQGRTPGKRALGLRVIDAHGGALSAEAVFVRNLTREIEVFWPFLAIANPEGFSGFDEAGFSLVAASWVLIFALMPLFNSDRRRVGDLIAGTLVVRMPKEVLVTDLGARSRRRGEDPASVVFTKQQLEVYGIYELQVLEDLLRAQRLERGALEAVAEKIQHKIGWQDGDRKVPPRQFLTSFYRAQRGNLEQGMLLGKARQKKRGGKLEDGNGD